MNEATLTDTYETVVNKTTYKTQHVGDRVYRIEAKLPGKRKFTGISMFELPLHLSVGDATNSEIRYHQLQLKYGRKSSNFGLLTAVQRAVFGIREPSPGLYIAPIDTVIEAQHAVLDILEAQ